MEQNMPAVDTPSDLMKATDDILVRLAEVRASLDEIQASLNRYDELQM